MSDSGSDHEHWADDFKMRKDSAVPAAGYDTHNGLRYHEYTPAVAETKKTKESASPAKQPAVDPRSIVYPDFSAYQPMQYAYAGPPQQMQYMQPYPVHYMQPHPVQVQYVQAQPEGMPSPAPAPVMPANNGMSYTYYPAGVTQATDAPTGPNHWQGRTKAEVDEDNQKIAAEEKAYEKCKVVPVGLRDDQMCWVVETDKSHTLRTFVAIKDLKGEWKKDPRYESWYFIIEKDEGEEKKTKGGK